jgi:hypothetical protein
MSIQGIQAAAWPVVAAARRPLLDVAPQSTRRAEVDMLATGGEAPETAIAPKQWCQLTSPGDYSMKISCLACDNKAKMSDHSRLIFASGPKDEQGLQHHFLYCRACHKFSEYASPGNPSILFFKLRNYTPIGVVSQEVVYDYYTGVGMQDPDSMRYAGLILQAMREDGLIQED